MAEQLIKKTGEGYSNVMPKSWIEAITDKSTGESLTHILQGFNMYFLSYTGNTEQTRCQVPKILRKKGLWITYVKYDGNVYTEWYNSNNIDDKSWGNSSNWRIGNNELVGDLTISANGNWVINGNETEFKAIGEKGNTPLIRIADNKLQVSYDRGDTYNNVSDNPVYTQIRTYNNKLQISTDLGANWTDASDEIAAYFRFNSGQGNNVGNIQISRNNKDWSDLSGNFVNNLHISKYIGVNETLPTSGVAEGTIYAKGPTYADSDTSHNNPIYRLWVYAYKGNTLAWQDNGEFTSIAAGIVQETGSNENAVMSQKAVTEISDKVDKLSEELEGIDALKDVISKRLSPFNKVTFDDEKYYSGGVNLFISGDAVDKNISINQLKLRVNKVSGASYKLRLVECEASGALKITKLSNEISLTEPSGDFNDETISLETTFTVAEGHKYGLIISDVGILKRDTNQGVSKYHIREIVYSQKVVGVNLLPYAQESVVNSVNINFISVENSFITPVKEEDFEKSIGQKSDNTIESDNLWGAIEEVNDKSLSSISLLDMKLDNLLADVEYEVGVINSTGNNLDSKRYIRTKNIYWLNKGTHVFSTATTPFGFFKYDNNLHFERVALSNGTDCEITESGYYRWVISFPIDVTTLGDSIKHGGYIYFGYKQQYDYEERNAINYAATQVNPFILSRKEEKMAHVSNFQFDNDGTMWLAYIGNETTTDENEKQVVNGVAVCYCNIVHVNPYTGEELGRATFKAGESIGDYTQPNEVAPYVPYINLISEGKVHVQFWAHMNGELTLAKFDVDKSSLEKTNFAAYTIKYNGVTRVLNPTGLKETYEAISGETIEDFDHVNMNTHYSLYDGYWYSVINNVFGTPSIPNFANQKFRSILVRSIDCVNWEVVHCYQEIPFTCECCMCIKNGVVYTTDRNNYVSAFNLTTKEVRKTLIPLGAGCKTSVFNYKGDVVFAATIPCEYDVDKQSYRGNLGLYKINEDLSIELLSRIMTNHGMHYPDLGSDGFDIFMSWSEDRRHIMLKLQRSNIGFSRIQL